MQDKCRGEIIMTNKETGNYILNALISAGADKAACNIRSTRTDELNIDNGNINLLRTNFTDNISLKAIKDNRSGLIRINSGDKETVDNAVSDCMEAVRASMVEEAEDISGITENCVVGSEAEADMDMLYFRLDELVKDTAERYPRIILNEIHAAFISGSHIYMNTNGVDLEELYNKYDVDISFSARDKDTSSSLSEYSIAAGNLDRPFLEIGNLAQVLEQTDSCIYPKPMEGKFEGTVILMPDVLNRMLNSLQSIVLSDNPLIDKTSQWKDALGKQVADTKLTLSCNYSDKEIIAAGNIITGDGYKAEDVTVIDKGVFKAFLVSLFGSKKTGIPRSLNYGGAFVVEPGDKSLEEIIASVDKGLLVGYLSGKNPDSSGEISGVAKTSFLIENGRIKEAVNETMISCNLLNILKNIMAISREQVTNGYYKLPYIAFDGVVISGK